MERGLSKQVMLAHPLSGIHSPLSTLSIELFPQPTGIDSGYVPGLEANKNQATQRHPGKLFTQIANLNLQEQECFSL